MCGARCPTFPRESALGSLCHYIAGANPKNYQPANIAMDLFPEVSGYAHDKKARHQEICRELWKPSTTTAMPPSELESQMNAFLEELNAE